MEASKIQGVENESAMGDSAGARQATSERKKNGRSATDSANTDAYVWV